MKFVAALVILVQLAFLGGLGYALVLGLIWLHGVVYGG